MREHKWDLPVPETSEKSAEPTVFVVDDDQAVRTSLCRLVRSAGLPVEAFPNAGAFLDGCAPDRPGCLVLDIRMPGMTGLELQEELARSGRRTPVIIISGHADVESAVRALKSGAVDFIKKPHKGKALLDCIRRALELDARNRRADAQRAEIAATLARLTPREAEVLEQMVAGKFPKQIALELGISRKTVDVHRNHIMTKLQAESLVDLIRMVQSQQSDGGSPSTAS